MPSRTKPATKPTTPVQSIARSLAQIAKTLAQIDDSIAAVDRRDRHRTTEADERRRWRDTL